MTFDEEAVLVHRALTDLDRLHDAYRAAARGHAIVLARMAVALDTRTALDGPAEDVRREHRRRMEQRVALARETDSVMDQRSSQVRRRIAELARSAER